MTDNIQDIEEFTDPEYLRKPIKTIIQEKLFKNISQENLNIINNFMLEVIKNEYSSYLDFENKFKKIRKIYKICPKKSQLLQLYLEYIHNNNFDLNDNIVRFLTRKTVRSSSGVVTITVMTSPGKFSCPHDCHYCPNEPGMPRSYLKDEPSVIRGYRNKWDPFNQFRERALVQNMNGHIIDKIEILVLGGTWSSYPKSYQEEFIRDVYYAANTFYDEELRNRLSLEEEIILNETTKCHIIGLTLETRPDFINKYELRRFRKYGVTRVQLGIQHSDNTILKKINRGCTTEDAITAIRLLKNNCFKVDIHIMPNLPFSTVEKDKLMFNYILNSPDLQADQWKIYPCSTVPYTKIKEWYENGSYVPYDENKLFSLLVEVKKKVHPWIRLNRVIRDIPNQYIIAGNKQTNMRQHLLNHFDTNNIICKCIRCREVRYDTNHKSRLVIRKYEASEGLEYFISFESYDDTYLGFIKRSLEYLNIYDNSYKTKLFGFLRLRVPNSKNANEFVFPELKNSSLIRELHVYGKLIEVHSKNKTHNQHLGFGSRLLFEAEKISIMHNYYKIAVISGIGVRNYYKKNGYVLEETYMTKFLNTTSKINKKNLELLICIIIFFINLINIYNFIR
jgi:ELP3 family radical SAM enzyme/protein acetyltransferase